MTDLAGPERGFSPDRDAFARYLQPALTRRLSVVLIGVAKLSWDISSMDGRE